VKFLIINTDYPQFLSSLYAQNPGLDTASYQQQMKVRNESLFGTADFYSLNLHKLGHEAVDIHANNVFMQKKWVEEYSSRDVKTIDSLIDGDLNKSNSQKLSHSTPMRYLKYLLFPLLKRENEKPEWHYEILRKQVEYYQPEIIWNHDLTLEENYLKQIKGNETYLIGQIAAPIPKHVDFKIYDLILSSLPNFVEYFSSLGVNSTLQKLSFEPGILSCYTSQTATDIPISFVGSLSIEHKNRIKWLELICNNFDPSEFKIWGNGINSLSQKSPIRQFYNGPAWGRDMYAILKKSKITLNCHINLSENYANNMRLFEATGMGALLITDWKTNIADFFEPDKEVITYKTAEECVELIKYYMNHDKEREEIARAGQKKTLTEHSTYERMKELVRIIERYHH